MVRESISKMDDGNVFFVRLKIVAVKLITFRHFKSYLIKIHN